MATQINYTQAQMNLTFCVNDHFGLELRDFSTASQSRYAGKGLGEFPQCSAPLPFIDIQCTGDSTTLHHGYKHDCGGTSTALTYDERDEYVNNYGKKVEMKLTAPNGLSVVYHMQFFHELNIVRTWAVVTNCGKEDIGLEHVSSFQYHGLCQNGAQPYYEKTDIRLPHSSWACEAQWQKYNIESLGLNRMVMNGFNTPGFGVQRYYYGSFSSWSSAEYLPMGMVSDNESGEIYFWQIESSAGWHAEYGTTAGNHLYVSLSGPTENEGHWWKNLKPGDSFQTVTAAFGVVNGDVSEATAELTKYRRRIRRLNEDNVKLNVVFNDYMNCLEGDPTEEREYPIIDKASALGCEYFCLDAGWYDKGPWWDRVGEWKESRERFPNGLGKVFDYARKKGLKAGIWLEIEVMGTECQLARELPDDWFFMRHGKRHIDHKRYLLDFRNPAVRDYATGVVDRLIEDYGIEFFKIDYNVTTAFGTDLDADSCGDGLLEHMRALHGWYDSLYERYPNLVIENCSSGGMRMDYGMLQRQSLQSTSDQTDYLYNSNIAANVATAVTPEQAGMWVYPYEDNAEHVIYNMVNGLLLRPYMSGQVWKLSDASMELLREGVALYKEIRPEIREGLPFFPLGLGDIRDNVLAYGLECHDQAYLSVFGVHAQDLEIPLNLSRPVKNVRVLYPSEGTCTLSLNGQTLSVHLPQAQCARLLKLEF